MAERGLCDGGVPTGTWVSYQASGTSAAQGDYDERGKAHGLWSLTRASGETEQVVYEHGREVGAPR